ncbi:hypothetical protein LTR49_028551, partial [Elasticomyces elasticus]
TCRNRKRSWRYCMTYSGRNLVGSRGLGTRYGKRAIAKSPARRTSSPMTGLIQSHEESWPLTPIH